jgi:hypothetical protein
MQMGNAMPALRDVREGLAVEVVLLMLSPLFALRTNAQARPATGLTLEQAAHCVRKYSVLAS